MKPIAANVYVETEYEGVNVGAVLTPRGTIAIDAPSYPRDARDWATRLHRLDKNPLQYLILTDCNGDRIINARWLNAPIITHQETADRLNSYDKRYPPAMIESLTVRNPDKGRDLNNGPVEKPAISFTGRLNLRHETYHVQIFSAPGPSSATCWIFLPDTGILFTGETVVVDRHPFLTEPTSGRWLNTLDTLLSWQDRIQQIIPGRGQFCTLEAVEPLRHYLQLMRDQVQDLIDHGKPREETTSLLPEFLSMFPIHHLPTEWVKRQIKNSLAHVYDEIQLSQADTPTS